MSSLCPRTSRAGQVRHATPVALANQCWIMSPRIEGPVRRPNCAALPHHQGRSDMNLWAVLLAAVSSFLLGGLWYSQALFGRAWNLANGGQVQSGHPAKVFGVSLVFSLVAATAFAAWLGAAPPLADARQGRCPGRLRLCRRQLWHQLPVRPTLVQVVAHRRGLSHGSVRALRPDPRVMALTLVLRRPRFPCARVIQHANGGRV